MSGIRTVHVGIGGRGRWPIECLQDDDRFQIVGLVDCDAALQAERREALALPAEAAGEALGPVLDRVEADAVIICSPTTTHAPLAREAFARGLHVLVEKAMTMDWAEAQALVREADAAGVRLCVSQNYRFQPRSRMISDLLRDAEAEHHPGQARIVDFIQHRYRPEPRTLNYPGAMVWDMSCHHMDLLIEWLGPVEAVTAHTYAAPWSQYPHDANIAAFIEFASGAVCHYVLTHDGRYRDQRTVIQGERGVLKVEEGDDGVRFFPLPEKQFGSSEPIELRPPEAGGDRWRRDGARDVIDAFHAFITHGREPGISGRENLKTLALCELLLRSAREGRRMRAEELTRSAAGA